MSVRFAACQVYETIPVQPANPPGTRAFHCSPIFPQPHLMTRVATEVARCPQIRPHVGSVGAHPGTPRIVTYAAWKYGVSPQWRYASGDVNKQLYK